jgi:hypothetical protein
MTPGPVVSCRLSAAGRLALTGTENGRAWLWDVPTAKLRGELFRHWERPPSKLPVVAVAILDKDRLVTGEAYGVFRLWEICQLESTNSTELRNRVELLTGWYMSADEVRLHMATDQWQERMTKHRMGDP